MASTTNAVDKLLDQAAAIWGSAPTPKETAYMARQLVQATLGFEAQWNVTPG